MTKGKWLKIALWLVITTNVYNIIEAIIALWAGIEADSIALFGFGLDSIIEFMAASVLLWRFYVEARGASQKCIEKAEHRAHQFVGITFLLLAAYVAIQSIRSLIIHTIPDESLIGIILACASLAIMPLISWGKLVAAKHVGSSALRAEAKETLACSILSLILLVGLVANATLGWWWADPVAALLMVPWLIKEGFEGISGDECCN